MPTLDLDTLHIPRIPFRCNSVEGNSCIPAEFEFHSKFRRNFFINFAGPSAKIDSSGIPGIARIPRIPPDSGRNQWGTVKTSFFHSGAFSVRRNLVSPELRPEWSADWQNGMIPESGCLFGTCPLPNKQSLPNKRLFVWRSLFSSLITTTTCLRQRRQRSPLPPPRNPNPPWAKPDTSRANFSDYASHCQQTTPPRHR
jgi:hypothetical protein